MADVPRTEGGKFAPGTSGNPGGLPKSVAKARRYCQKHSLAMFQKLVEIANNPAVATKDQIAAAKIVGEHGIGKPTQTIAGDPHRPLTVAAIQAEVAHAAIEQASRFSALTRARPLLPAGTPEPPPPLPDGTWLAPPPPANAETPATEEADADPDDDGFDDDDE